MNARKKKKTKEAWWKHEKEMEITRRVRARENKSGVALELKLEDPIEVGDDASSSKNERAREVLTSVVHHEPTAACASSGHEVERCGDVLMPRKRATSSKAIDEQEAKRTRSPRSLEASPASPPPAASAVR